MTNTDIVKLAKQIADCVIELEKYEKDLVALRNTREFVTVTFVGENGKVREGTATDIMAITGRPRNVIHPRIGELRELGYLEEIGDKVIDRHKHAILRVTSKGDAVSTVEVEDITPAKRYYSKGDYRAFCREFYDYLQVSYPPNDPDVKRAYEQLRNFLATKK